MTSLKAWYRSHQTTSQYDAYGEWMWTCETTITFEDTLTDPDGLGFITVFKEANTLFDIQKGAYHALVTAGGVGHEAKSEANCTHSTEVSTVPFGAVALNTPYPGDEAWEKFGPFMITGDGSMRGAITSTQDDRRCAMFEYDVKEQTCQEEWALFLPGAGNE